MDNIFPANLKFLSGGGEMALLVSRKDWSKTVLGIPEHWPSSLRTSLGIVLNSRFPMFLFWGKELLCFYNDAYRLSLGDNGKHPAILGIKAQDAWPETWEVIKPKIESILAGDEATIIEDQLISIFRNGNTEELYWTYSYSRVNDANGNIEGVLITCNETTEKLKTLSQVAESEERFRNMAESSEILIALGDETGNATYFNKAWATLTGRPMKELLAFGWADLLHPEDRAFFLNIFMEAFAERAPFNGEFRVLAATGKYRWQLAKGTPRFHQDGTFAGYISSCTDFTEIKEIQDLLKESEQRFKNVANNAPVLIWMAATDKQYYFFNLAWLKFTGHTLKQEKGQGWRQGIHADDIERCMTICDAAFDRREEFSIEYRLKRNDGQFRWLSDHATPRFTSEGVFEGYIGACMDIHDRIVSQKIVKENEERLNIVIEASELVTWELNLKTKAVQYSERYLTMLGHPKEKYLTHDQILKHLHPEDLHKREKAFRLAYQTGILHYESRLIWEDKSIHWMEVRGKLFYDERQKPEKAMGTIRDITAEKSHESEIMEREQKFRLLADSMPQHIWTADPQGNLNYFNQSVFNYSGLTPEELQRVGWLDIVHPDDREENMIKWTQAIAAGTDFLLEHRFRRYDGSYRWQLSRAIPQKGDDGQIQRWVGTSTDIQDQKMFANELENQVQQRTNELEQKNAELEKMNKELESFAYISSHDLQEPLRKIQTFSTRIVEKEYATLSETAKDNFQRMQVAAKRMQTLIEDLLAYSRTTVTERKYDNTDLQQIIEEVKEDLSEEIEQKKAIIKIGQKCYTGIIPFQMRQLLQNLMSNSLKFSVEGRQAVITISCEIKLGSQLHNAKLTPEKSYCHISVADNGIGFEPQYSEKIFEVFQRLHGRGDYLGTGIGLAIVKKIAENHQGTITANGSANAGATFDMYFPSDLAKNAKQTKTAKTTNN